MSIPKKTFISGILRRNFHSQVHSDRDPEVDGKRGYIRRVSVERDARLKKLELTEVGIRMQEGTIRNINRLESTLRQGISDEDLEVFFRVIRKMRSNIEIQQGETNRRRE